MMDRSLLYCAFWVFHIYSHLECTNAGPIVNNNLLLNKSGSLAEKQKDCQVNKKYEDSHWSGEPIPFMVYVEEEEDAGAVSFSITYDGKDITLFRDKSILSQKENKVYEYRNGNIEEKSLETYIDVSGWTQMEISMNGQHLIVKVMGIVVLNHTASFPVKGLVIHGKHITICEDNSPTWLVKTADFARIPLEPSRQVVDHSGNRTYVLTLRSEDEFTPCIGIGENRKCLTQESRTESGFVLYLEVITGYIYVFLKIGEKRENLINIYKQEMKFIEVSSNTNSFSASLKVFTLDSVTTVNSNYGKVIYLYLGLGISIGIGLSLAVAIVVWIIWQKMQSINPSNSTESSSKSDATKETTPLAF